MDKKEKFILISVFIILAFVLNYISCFSTEVSLNTTYYFFFSLIPYFIYSSVIFSIKNKPVIYTTAVFILIIDFLMKLNIGIELIKQSENVVLSWMLMAPLVLVSLTFIVFVLFITGAWICRKKGISKINLKFNIPESFQFDDDELTKFLFIILSFGFLINFQNIIHVSTGLMSIVLGVQNAEVISGQNLIHSLLSVILAMLPYFIFVTVSYYVKCRQISYIIGFVAIVFDIYLKVVSYMFLNSEYSLGTSLTEVLSSVFNPLTFIIFVPVAFAVLFFGKKLLDKNIIEEEEIEPESENG